LVSSWHNSNKGAPLYLALRIRSGSALRLLHIAVVGPGGAVDIVPSLSKSVG
jgi:hypothetical protein